jgi:thiosulfate/3-mercaptopyruvate sulfurtransferase
VRANFVPEFQPDRLSEIGSLRGALDSPDVKVVDARSAAEFEGTQVLGARGGHIPGASHLEWKELLQEDGRFKSPEELRALFQSRGIHPEQTAITC